MKKLIVKAANGKHKDLVVEYSEETDGTIKSVKSYIYRHHPAHPPVVSQKLISGGRLLKDEDLVKDNILLTGEGVPVFHLVMYERSLSAPALNRQVSATPSLDTMAEQDETSPSSPPPPPPPLSPPPSTGPLPPTAPEVPHLPPSTAPPGPTPPLTVPWAAYHHHHPVAGQSHPMHRFAHIHHMQMFGAPGGAAMGGPGMFFGGPAPFFNYHGSYNNNPFAANAAQMAQWYQNYYARNIPTMATNVEGAGEDGDDLMDAPEGGGGGDRLQDGDPEDEVPLNAAGGIMAVQDFQHRRDMIDFLYMLMMASLLGTVAYVTGSLGRFLIFSAGVVFMLLNQGGWFALQRRQQARRFSNAQQQDPNGPHDRVILQQGERGGEGAEGEEEEEEGEEGEGEEEIASLEDERNGDQINGGLFAEPRREEGDGEALPAQEQRPGLFSTIFVFVTSFFTSLIPQENLQLNN